MVARALLPILAAVIAAALLGGGCSGSDDDESPPPGSTGVPVPGLEGASTEPETWAATSDGTKLLTDVRAARRGGYDRVVFEFRNGVPGYVVRYVVRRVTADGSGEEVAVAGGAVLLVRMEPALDADLTQESAPRTYTGPTRFSPDGAAVVELVRTGGFEAVLTWAVGVDEERPFRVTRLDDPARVVIDVAAPNP